MPTKTEANKHYGKTASGEDFDDELQPGVDMDDPFEHSGIPFGKPKELAEAETVFEILRIEPLVKTFKSEGVEETKEVWESHIITDAGKEWLIDMGRNEKRDEQMEAAVELLAKGGRLSGYKLIKSGRAFYFKRHTPGK